MNDHCDTSAAMLTFEDIWVYSKRTTLAASEEDRTAVATSMLAPHKKWLTRIKGEATADKTLSAHQRTLIAGAHGKLIAGQVTVLTGHSGSGKSVLLRVLSGLSPISAGNVWLQHGNEKVNSEQNSSKKTSYDRLSIHNTSPTQWRAQVALLAQHPQLLEGSVLDNLTMPYRLQAYQYSHFDMEWHIKQLAQLERTADFLQQDANHLSGGERQLVNTLRLLQLEPQVLLLDEPTAALDADTSAKLVHLLINWLRAKPARTLLWITHDTQDIMPLADKHWHMQAGVLTEVF